MRPISLPPRRGFSLLELLIVIACVAVLSALLLPVLAHVREQSKVTQCAAQLRQVGVAFHLYAADNRGSFPTMVYGKNHAKAGQPIPASWGYAGMPFFSRLLEPPYDVSPQAKGTLKNAAALFCPAATRPDGTPLRLPNTPAVIGSVTIPYIGYNYIYIDSSIGYSANLYGDYDNVKAAKRVNNSPLLWCFTPEFFPAAGTAHKRVANALRIDGSVRLFTHAEVDYRGPDSPADLGLRILKNLSQ